MNDGDDVLIAEAEAEKLESEKCAIDGIFEAMTSPIMKINIVFSIIIIFLTFWYSYKAILSLIHRNIYSNCSRILLIFNLIDSNIWQINYLIIKIRDLIQILSFSDDRCQIQFHYPECSFQHPISYYCIVVSVFGVFSLTCDRFLAYFLTKQYEKHQKTIAAVMIGVFLVTSLLIYLWGFYGVPQVGYVPTCYYPPHLSIERHNMLNDMLFSFVCLNFGLSTIILILNLVRDKKLHHSNFNTSTRYISFENLETTKAIFSISTTQFFFLSATGLAYIVLRYFEIDRTQKLFNLIIPFFTTILYGNLSIPMLICYQSESRINRRKKTIGSMTSASDNMETRMSGLRKMWK